MDLLNLFEFFAIGSNNFLQDRDLDVNWKIVDIIHVMEINLFWHFLKKCFSGLCFDISYSKVSSKVFGQWD